MYKNVHSSCAYKHLPLQLFGWSSWKITHRTVDNRTVRKCYNKMVISHDLSMKHGRNLDAGFIAWFIYTDSTTHMTKGIAIPRKV